MEQQRQQVIIQASTPLATTATAATTAVAVVATAAYDPFITETLAFADFLTLILRFLPSELDVLNLRIALGLRRQQTQQQQYYSRNTLTYKECVDRCRSNDYTFEEFQATMTADASRTIRLLEANGKRGLVLGIHSNSMSEYYWTSYVDPSIYQDAFSFNKLSDASQNLEEYKPMPYRLANAVAMRLNNNNNNISSESLPPPPMSNNNNNINTTKFEFEWRIPYSDDDMGDMKKIPYAKSIHLVFSPTQMSLCYPETESYTSQTITITAGSLRPSVIRIKNGTLILKWPIHSYSISHDVVSISFGSSGAIEEKTTHRRFNVPSNSRKKVLTKTYDRHEIQSSMSYSLFPWFNDVYQKGDIFSNGLAPHTVSFFNRDYAVAIRFRTATPTSGHPRYPEYFQFIPL
jgi:hypothetical protein